MKGILRHAIVRTKPIHSGEYKMKNKLVLMTVLMSLTGMQAFAGNNPARMTELKEKFDKQTTDYAAMKCPISWSLDEKSVDGIKSNLDVDKVSAFLFAVEGKMRDLCSGDPDTSKKVKKIHIVCGKGEADTQKDCTTEQNEKGSTAKLSGGTLTVTSLSKNCICGSYSAGDRTAEALK